jgi:hypothetical protein
VRRRWHHAIEHRERYCLLDPSQLPLIVVGISIRDSIFLKHPLPQRRWNVFNDFLMGHDADIADRNLPNGARRQGAVGNYLGFE